MTYQHPFVAVSDVKRQTASLSPSAFWKR